ncbi:MAG: SH3 domain-containing protein [Betaproteobacteria bacterium]|nr:SH3 domain-containing protein [Betaproteobacteria bacterium]
MNVVPYLLVWIFALLLPGQACAQAVTAQTIAPTPLRARPARDAAIVAELPANAALALAARRGGWYQASYQGRTGWVMLFSIRLGSAAVQGGVGADAAGLVGMAFARHDASQTVEAAGVRGLSEETLKNAHFDPAQLRRLDQLAVTRQAAAAFAARAHLVARPVPFLAAPEAQAPPSISRDGLP